LARLEDVERGAIVNGILPNQAVTVVDVNWLGSTAIELTYKDGDGNLGNELIYRDSEPTLEIVTAGRPWSFDGDGATFRLVSEAYRIRLAHLFDPRLAVHTSSVDALPHQITAVYEEMLPRQPLRYLLADDPGAGKTIMTGLYLKELLVRGDLKRCMIVCPGNLVEQWRDELHQRFQLPFEILTRERIETAPTGNPFQEQSLLICRLDQLSRNEDIQAKLEATDWDVIVCDEAHKMSASFFGGEVRRTKRYQLGQLLGTLTRHFLLLTATPHNGKEEDFQLFMALLDGDRFEGRFRDGVHLVDTSDLMRRMVKEQLLKFDGTPLFPERYAYTVNYKLSELEVSLYHDVTNYVREEMNRADQLEGGRGNRVGFALTILQRRLASSPEAIYRSIQRRRERLAERLREERVLKRGADARLELLQSDETASVDLEDVDAFYDEAPAEEVEDTEDEVVDRASAARTIAELEAEIQTLRRLEDLAQQVRSSGTDQKWEQLSRLLQGDSEASAAGELFDAQGHRRKLIIFTEHRDTLNYLTNRIRTLIGRAEAFVTIQGSMGREDRRKAQEAFTQDPEVQILIATDAAGEGINLQRAHLMVNYDLPWNPNRVEQRFGRIHRIGQTEVCHLWNLVASETREGEVFNTLLQKLEQQRKSLGGAVFDVLGISFTDTPLRQLLIEAIRYGDRPEVRARLTEVIDDALDIEHLQDLIEERALTHGTIDTSRLRNIREDMERAEARRLQPHFIASFFREAFDDLGGTLREREPKRYEITHVPSAIRDRDRVIGVGETVQKRYERITFEKDRISIVGKPIAAFVCPGHPLLNATLDLILERYRALLKRGAVLVDPDDESDAIRVLFYLEHAIQDGRVHSDGKRWVVSRQMQFVEIDSDKTVRHAGYAPYLDYRPMTDEEHSLVAPSLEAEWLSGGLESEIIDYAVEHLIPAHIAEVKARKAELVPKTIAAVQARLTKEINYWDNRANQLEQEEEAGRPMAKINSAFAPSRSV
jgi:superfamily II DNA or RNA helicase